jgi:hypothetical protein
MGKMLNRRTLLLSSSVIALSACSGNSFIGSKPSADELMVQEFIQRETALVDIYFAGINQERSYRTQLIQLRNHHLDHLTLWTNEVSATPNPSPTGLQVASITQLLLAEEEHLNFCLTSCLLTDDKQILQNIGQIASSVTQHIYWLNKMITPAVPKPNARYEGSDIEGAE